MRLTAGLDEVGTGALCGPIVVVVAAFPEDRVRMAGVADSKTLTKRKLRELAPLIVREAAWIGFGFASNSTIDELGLAEAWQVSARMALEGAPEVALLIVDGDRLVDGFLSAPMVAEPKADARHWQVSAASIVAKVMRDQEMEDLAAHFPQYGLERHVGYGTKEHREALLLHGPCPLHRQSFIGKIVHPEPISRFGPKRRRR